MKQTSTNLTEGSTAGVLLSFALPILTGQIFQNLYNSADAVVVGNAVGTTALAAVSSCSDISHLITGFFSGLSAGVGVLFGRCYGANELKKLHDAIHTAICFALILGTAMTVIGIVLTPFLLIIVDCPWDVYGEAKLYLRIYLIGVLFTAIYNVGAGVLRAAGDSKTPFHYLVIASITNIALDLVLVVFCKWGVAGTAFATICAQLLSVVLVFRRMLCTNDVYRLIVRDLRIDRQLLFEIMSLGLPAAIQSSLTAVSNLFVMRYINSFGSAAMAGMGAGKKIDKFVSMAAQALGLAITTFVSQNCGAKKIERAYRGIRAALVMGLVYAIVIGALVYSCAPAFVRIFTADENAAVYGVDMVRTMIPLYYIFIFYQIIANAVRGFGKSLAVMVLGTAGLIGCRQVFLAISMHLNRVASNIYYGYPVGWGSAALLVFLYYCLVIRRKYKTDDPSPLVF